MSKKNISKDFGKFISLMRNKKEITKSDLAKESHVSRYTITKLESNESGITLDNAYALISALNTSFGEFEVFLVNQSPKTDIKSELSKDLGSDLADEILDLL